MAREQLTFTKIDIASLHTEVQDLWVEYCAMHKAIEAALNKHHAPAGKAIKFIKKYNVELRIALQNSSNGPVKNNGTALQDFLDAQEAGGRAS